MTAFEAFEYEEPREAYEYEQPETQEAFEFQEFETQESELAQELLEIASEAELEEFLGKLVRGVARGARAFVRSPIGRAVGGVLRNVAKTALPIAGSALGSFIAPGVGTAIGGRLGSMAANLLEAEEMEALGEAEAELEAARRYVRWARGTVRNAMRAPYGVPPRLVARSAAVASARRYAPSLLHTRSGRVSPWQGRRGQGWGSPAGYHRRQCVCGAADGSDVPDQTDSFGLAFDDGDDASAGSEMELEMELALPQSEAPARGGSPSGTGRWYRRGNRIVLVGA